MLATVHETSVVLHDLQFTRHHLHIFSNLQLLTIFPFLIADCVLTDGRDVSMSPAPSSPASAGVSEVRTQAGEICIYAAMGRELSGWDDETFESSTRREEKRHYILHNRNSMWWSAAAVIWGDALQYGHYYLPSIFFLSLSLFIYLSIYLSTYL